MGLFIISFHNGAPPRFSLQTESFASIEDSLGLTALCDLHDKKTYFLKPISTFRFFRNVRLSKTFFPVLRVTSDYFWTFWVDASFLSIIVQKTGGLFLALLVFLRKKSDFFSKKPFLMFPVVEKWFSSLMSIPSGILRYCKFDEISSIVTFCIFKRLHWDKP